jgi:hypothetical protein
MSKIQPRKRQTNRSITNGDNPVYGGRYGFDGISLTRGLDCSLNQSVKLRARHDESVRSRSSCILTPWVSPQAAKVFLSSGVRSSIETIILRAGAFEPNFKREAMCDKDVKTMVSLAWLMLFQRFSWCLVQSSDDFTYILDARNVYFQDQTNKNARTN